jgi:UrcA family protein
MTSKKTLSANLYTAFAVMGLAVSTVSAYAAEPDEVTISAPATQTVGRDYATNAPIQETTVKVGVSYDPVTLTTNSGVALLKDSVADAARKACDTADPLTDDGGTCVREAISSAQSQIAEAVTKARSSTAG